jgi:hypothetical protein
MERPAVFGKRDGDRHPTRAFTIRRVPACGCGIPRPYDDRTLSKIRGILA